MSKGHTCGKSYRCSQCSRPYSLARRLKRHVRVQLGEKPYRCLRCTKTFPVPAYLWQHLRVHINVKSCSCSQLRKIIYSVSLLAQTFENVQDFTRMKVSSFVLCVVNNLPRLLWFFRTHSLSFIKTHVAAISALKASKITLTVAKSTLVTSLRTLTALTNIWRPVRAVTHWKLIFFQQCCQLL
jgi:hypothetical protein